jgi:hypothetical protein
MAARKCSASGSCSNPAIRAELSTAITGSAPGLFENLSRRARIEKWSRGYALGDSARAHEVNMPSRHNLLAEIDSRNVGNSFDAFFQDILHRLAAALGHAAGELFGFRA